MPRRIAILLLALSLVCQGGIFSNERELRLGGRNTPLQIAADLQGSIGEIAASRGGTENGNLNTREAFFLAACPTIRRYLLPPRQLQLPMSRLAGLRSEAAPAAPFHPAEWGLTNSQMARTDG
ncbi:MAG: hypothetical protein WA705_24180 [Candidatus Ozemobacteraceae bacterium]